MLSGQWSIGASMKTSSFAPRLRRPPSSRPEVPVPVILPLSDSRRRRAVYRGSGILCMTRGAPRVVPLTVIGDDKIDLFEIDRPFQIGDVFFAYGAQIVSISAVFSSRLDTNVGGTPVREYSLPGSASAPVDLADPVNVVFDLDVHIVNPLLIAIVVQQALFALQTARLGKILRHLHCAEISAVFIP